MKSDISPFRIIVIFILLIIIGVIVIPFLNFNYRPALKGSKITLTYSWNGVSPEIVERQVTAPLEGVLATLRGVSSIFSESSRNQGYITLEFDDVDDLQTTRFEIATLIRQIASTLPEGVSYPKISQGHETSSKILLTYTLNGKLSNQELQQFGVTHLVPSLENASGVKEIKIYGVQSPLWHLSYSPRQLASLDITTTEIRSAISNYFEDRPLGLVEFGESFAEENKIAVYLKTAAREEIAWDRIPVKKVGDRIIFLNSVCSIMETYRLPDKYYRINGLNSVTMVVYVGHKANDLIVARVLKDKMRELRKTLPEQISLTLSYDNSEFLEKELHNILWRVGLSLIILLFFVWLANRSLVYLFIIVSSIFCNITLAFICYFLFQIEIQLYSLAGFTISLGIIIDNTIIMVDHWRKNQNKKVFLALLAATITTIGALSIIFFLEEDQALNLLDFVYVLIINLTISLLVSLFFIPALIRSAHLGKSINNYSLRNKRRVVKLNNFYFRINKFLSRFRLAVYLMFVLLFGLPFHLLPEKLGSDTESEKYKHQSDTINVETSWYENLYNSTFGSEWYRGNIKSTIELWLGGTLHLFYENVFSSSYQGQLDRTLLLFNGKMPLGSSIQQMNAAFLQIENFLSQFDEIEQFETNIQNAQQATIKIYFKPAYEFTSFPYFLKAKLTEKAIYIGGMDSDIHGVGRGFSNSLNTNFKNTNLYLFGYNYDQLMSFADSFKNRLLESERIVEVDLLGKPSFFVSPNFEYYMKVDKEELARQELEYTTLHQFLQQVNFHDQSLWRGQIGSRLVDIHILPEESGQLDVWNVKNYPIIKNDNSHIKLSSFADLSRRKVGNHIIRENQQYRIVLAFDFIGPEQLKERYTDRFIAEGNRSLPLGYQLKEQSGLSGQNQRNQYWILLLICAIIFLIGAILFESIWQPLLIIFLVPVAFIGVFITFYFFKINFDEGGYASFILLSGVAVNAGYFIINDYNNLLLERPTVPLPKLYQKAFQRKIFPIMLTICSTIAGMIPFLANGDEKAFWHALAAGTTGGLIFSILGVFIILPFVIPRKQWESVANNIQ
ncbi:MAG: efflux RND transporter permease subunit [Cytophagales bacterium]|nr:efflux RND transporter permease subunit [Cytophagales bacterium]